MQQHHSTFLGDPLRHRTPVRTVTHQCGMQGFRVGEADNPRSGAPAHAESREVTWRTPLWFVGVVPCRLKWAVTAHDVMFRPRSEQPEEDFVQDGEAVEGRSRRTGHHPTGFQSSQMKMGYGDQEPGCGVQRSCDTR